MENTRFSLGIRIFAISAIFLFFVAVILYCALNQVKFVTVTFSDGHSTCLLTGKTNVGGILESYGIMLMNDDVAFPSVDDYLDETNTITIAKNYIETPVFAEKSEDINSSELIQKYATVVEKVNTEEIEIPYETITNDSSTGAEIQTRVTRKGVNGIKQLMYMVRYQDDVEVAREQIREEVVEEPVPEVVEIKDKVTAPAPSSKGSYLADLVAGQTPEVMTFNCSAYAGDTSTASGARPQVMYTLAAGRSFPFGTVIYIPYFENASNGGWFVVQDRGGAITDGHLDIYMSSEAACNSFGRRNLTCYVYY
jgi:3D (Asp-Asp-Asp) domain-containing protein